MKMFVEMAPVEWMEWLMATQAKNGKHSEGVGTIGKEFSHL